MAANTTSSGKYGAKLRLNELKPKKSNRRKPSKEPRMRTDLQATNMANNIPARWTVEIKIILDRFDQESALVRNLHEGSRIEDKKE